MLTYNIVPGSTDVSVVIRIVDSTDGTPETGVVYNTSGIDLQYRRELAASTAITEATLAALTTAHADGGFLHIGNGYYRLDLPDAAVASGVAGCLVHGTVTGMVVIGCYIQLEGAVNSNYTRVGAPAGASVSADIAAMKVDTAAILVDTGTTLDARIPAALVSGRMDVSVGAMAANVMTAAAAAADLTTELQSGLATSAALDAVDNFLDTEVATILAAVDTEIAAIITTLGVAGAGLTALATQASVTAIDDLLDTEMPALTTAVATLQTSVDDLPTNAELATALGTADDAVLAAIAALNNLSAAQVNAEVVDALATDTYAEPAQGSPGATIALSAKINYLYKAWRNRSTQTATEYALYADDGTTKDHEAPCSDDATTFVRGEVTTGA